MPPTPRPITRPLGSDEFREWAKACRLFDRLLATAAARLPFEAAQDAVSETLLRLAELLADASEANPIRDLFAFATHILRDNICKAYRDKQRAPWYVPSELLADVTDRSGSHLLADLYSALLSEAPSRLRGKALRAFVLVVIDGRTPKQAAEVCGCCVNRLYHDLATAREVTLELIREKLAERGAE